MPEPFVPGLEVARRFYVTDVRPALSGVPHAAALVGPLKKMAVRLSAALQGKEA